MKTKLTTIIYKGTRILAVSQPRKPSRKGRQNWLTEIFTLASR